MRDFANIGPNMDDTDFPAGWYFSGAFNPTSWFGIVGEVDGSYKNSLDLDYVGFHSSSNLRVYTFMGGARFFKKVGRAVPAQFLTGAAHMQSKVQLTPGIPDYGDTIKQTATDFALQPGGGLTIYLTERVGVRLAADYRTIIDLAEDETTTPTSSARSPGLPCNGAVGRPHGNIRGSADALPRPRSLHRHLIAIVLIGAGRAATPV